jgi:hypothetical protein
MAKQKQLIQKKTPNAADEVERSVRSIQAAFDKGDRETLRELMTEDHVSIMTYTPLFQCPRATEVPFRITTSPSTRSAKSRSNSLPRRSPSRRTRPQSKEPTKAFLAMFCSGQLRP